jgi:hypothetical protein
MRNVVSDLEVGDTVRTAIVRRSAPTAAASSDGDVSKSEGESFEVGCDGSREPKNTWPLTSGRTQAPSATVGEAAGRAPRE